MQGTRGMGGMLRFGECCQTFRGVSSKIPGNVAKHCVECLQTFWGMSANIPEDVCSCHVTYACQSESTLHSYLNVKELLARNRREI